MTPAVGIMGTAFSLSWKTVKERKSDRLCSGGALWFGLLCYYEGWPCPSSRWPRGTKAHLASVQKTPRQLELCSSAPRSKNVPKHALAKAGPHPTGKSLAKSNALKTDAFVAQGGRTGKSDFVKRCFFRSFGDRAFPTSRTPAGCQLTASRQLSALFFACTKIPSGKIPSESSSWEAS